MRLSSRGWTLWGPSTGHHYGVPDAHDNTFLLLELLLAVPFTLGFQASALELTILILLQVKCPDLGVCLRLVPLSVSSLSLFRSCDLFSAS